MPSRAMMTLPLPSGEAAHVTSYGFDAGAGRLAVRLLLLLLPAGGVRCRVVSLKLPDSRRDRRLNGQKAVRSATLDRSSTRGSGPASSWECRVAQSR